MVTVAFYSLNKETNVYDVHQGTDDYMNEVQARLRALAFNWAYTVICEY